MSTREDASSTDSSDVETNQCSPKFDPMKALYAKQVRVPVQNAPMYNNLQQFEAAQSSQASSSNTGSKLVIIPVGKSELVHQIEEEKKKEKERQQKLIEEKNKQRFAAYQGMVTVPAKPFKVSNLLTRIPKIKGPLAALKTCVDERIRVKVVTRGATSVRGELHGNLCAFDKQWNLALSDVLEIWTRKKTSKRKIPPSMGVPVPKGVAATKFNIPVVTETSIGKGLVQCRRHMNQLFVRGEHVVLVNIVT